MKRIVLTVLALGAVTVSVFGDRVADDVFIGPLPGWLNLREAGGAVGDGKADDTEALQAAFDRIARAGEAGPRVLYIPAGTYRITRTLVMTRRAGISILGENPETTIILWDGPAVDKTDRERTPAFNSEEWKAWDGRHPAEMFWLNARHSRIGRLTFDGAGKAAAGIAYKWHDTNAPDQCNSHRLNVHDVVFRDCAIGFDGGGKQLWLDSEVLFERCQFLRCSEFGIGLRTFNSVDYWIWDSLFEECGVGISNEPMPHSGVFSVYRSVFLRSKIADASNYHTQFFAMRDNVSVGSRRFFLGREHGNNGAYFSITGNRIVDAIEDDPIRIEQAGMAFIADNRIERSNPAKGAAITVGLSDRTWASAVVVGNRFRNVGGDAPVAVNGQSYVYDNVPASDDLALPVTAFAGFAPAVPFDVVAVESGANAVAIQAAIDEAVKRARAKPETKAVVYLPTGRYEIDKTLVVPAGAAIEIIGDNYQPDWHGTFLVWTGEPDVENGAMIRLEGPSKAALRDFGIYASTSGRWPGPDEYVFDPNTVAACIRVENADQVGGRVYARECVLGGAGIGMLVDGLDDTVVECRAHEGAGFDHGWRREWDEANIDRDPLWPYPSVRAIGGKRTAAGETKGGGVWIYGADTGRFQVMNGARLLLRDNWYENNSLPFYTMLTGAGQMTVETMFHANFDHPTLQGCTPTYDLKDFKGKLTLINPNIARPFATPPEERMVSFRGDCTGAEVLTLNLRAPETFSEAASDGARTLHVNRRTGNNGDDLRPDEGAIDHAWIASMLEHTRNAKPMTLDPTPADITDVRLHRIYTGKARAGLHIK
ncbi:MAG: glycoside hydrolase family 55 protein [Kiritimatiellaeota bacterium]|nr:glycoside hydrolase family 55 protein [Kiritimatiellota bacterium]